MRKNVRCMGRRIAIAVLMSTILVSCSKNNNNSGKEDTLTPSVVVSEETTEEKIAKIEATDEVKRSLLSAGNNHRVKAVIDKMKNGDETTIAYIGGSITEGYLVNTTQNYAIKTTKALRELFSNENVKLVNAGLSGTSSTIGLMRVKEDVISENPDLVVIEFAVNDASDLTSKMAYESLVKEVLTSESKPAVVLLFTLTETGYTCQEHMSEIGTEYQLPMISVGDAILPEISAGTMT